MNDFKTMTAALSLTALLGACSPSAIWTDYTYKPHHFAAAFTAPPKAGPGDNPFLVEENDGEVDFGVTVACAAAPKNSDLILSDAIVGTRSSGTVRNVTYVALGQTMGREFMVDRAGASTVRERIFAKDNCLYIVFATTAGGADDERVAHFLDSFRLL